ncbi:hypothetical protein [Jiangella muralis]|uniref:hypothetical protein n=1 Tax=Jiangella muralis TaxID=702383 RepID=UPI00069D677E|nr:hypothetical protein [Jiangella muralis]
MTDLLGRKRLPADALPFAAVTLVTNTFEVGRAANGDHALAEELLGYEHTYGQQPLADLVANTPTKAAQVVLAVALGALEASIGKHTWRNPTSTARKYLRQLEAWGYALSEVEQLVTADPAERAPAAEVEEPDPASGDESEVNGDDSENAPDA